MRRALPHLLIIALAVIIFCVTYRQRTECERRQCPAQLRATMLYGGECVCVARPEQEP